MPREPASPGEIIVDLRINEVVSQNAGVWVDEQGETDDYVELYNPTATDRVLSSYLLFDNGGGHSLPKLTLPSHERILLWADNSPEQGATHLPFKVSSEGEHLKLVRADGKTVDEVSVPALAEHHAYARFPDGNGAFADCGFASPARSNGVSCSPAAAEVVAAPHEFAKYTWPSPWPATPLPLRINEASLSPANFVEVENTSSSELDLSGVELRLAVLNPRLAYPSATEGVRLAWPQERLGPGEFLRVAVTVDDLGEIAAAPNFEGVLSAFDTQSGRLVDRVGFSDWPAGASLARDTSPSGRFRYCRLASPGAANDVCDALPSRPVGRYLHDFQTPGDFHALSSGHASLDQEAIEFLIDTSAGDTVAFLNSNVFSTHYNYVREELYQEGPIDICTPAGLAAYRTAWATFVQDNFYATEGRTYELGSLVKYAGSNIATVEISGVNAISPEQLKHVFFTLMQHVPDPENWAVRPTTPEQSQRFAAVEGELPLVDMDEPFRNVTIQPLVLGEAYGTLRWVPSTELDSQELGPRDIVLTDAVPNDIPLIAGLITETFQTPLAHVNVLSRGRGTPNMALRDARNDPRIKGKIGRLVKLSISGFGFSVSDAEPAEALAFWEEHKPSGEPLVPRLDTSLRGVLPLRDHSFADLPAIGGKAAQFAELSKVELCEGSSVPRDAFAIPVVHALEHLEQSGARALLSELRQNSGFLTDPAQRAEGLTRVRRLIETHPLDRALHDEIVAAIHARWPDGRVRFRSSSNVEDLAGFNGAGLYESEGVDIDDDADYDTAIRGVWSSLWNDRAFAEREYYGVDQSKVAMAILVHPGFPSERANGVIVTRNVIAPWIGDSTVYINAQIGEALVTNPAPGIESDEFLYDPESMDRGFFRHSTFSPDVPVMTDAETQLLACSALAVHRHLASVLDPNHENSWLTFDLEFKLVGPERALVIKQARPYSFGQDQPASWCQH